MIFRSPYVNQKSFIGSFYFHKICKLKNRFRTFCNYKKSLLSYLQTPPFALPKAGRRRTFVMSAIARWPKWHPLERALIHQPKKRSRVRFNIWFFCLVPPSETLLHSLRGKEKQMSCKFLKLNKNLMVLRRKQWYFSVFGFFLQHMKGNNLLRRINSPTESKT